MARISYCRTFFLLASSTYGVMHSKSYMGCYKDSLPRAFPDYYDTGLTVAGCYQKAIELGYEMFAIQNGGECWLDDSTQNNYDKYGKSDKCKGESGGKWLNSVYKIKSEWRGKGGGGWREGGVSLYLVLSFNMATITVRNAKKKNNSKPFRNKSGFVAVIYVQRI